MNADVPAYTVPAVASSSQASISIPVTATASPGIAATTVQASAAGVMSGQAGPQPSISPSSANPAPKIKHDPFIILPPSLVADPLQPEVWREWIQRVESSGDIEMVKKAYRTLLGVYPNTSSSQISFMAHFLVNPETFTQAEALFKEFLKPSPWVDLWRYYLVYVRRTNINPAMRPEICKAYEYVLNHVGQDKDSGDIWHDYIQFLQSGEASTPWEAQQKMDALRKVYHRAVVIPLENVQRLWQEMESFENNLNRTLAKKFLLELSPAHTQARQVLREAQTHIQHLMLPPPACPPSTGNFASGSVGPGQGVLYLPGRRAYTDTERSLVNRWKAYLKWEEGNPLLFEDKDRNALIIRVTSVYRKAIVRMRFFPEIWFMAYTWLNSIGKTDEAITLLKDGIEATPTSPLLNLALADALEVKKEYAAVHELFTNYLATLKAELAALKEVKDAEAATAGADPTIAAVATNGTAPAAAHGTESQNSQDSNVSSDDASAKYDEFTARRNDYGVIWIMYEGFARRSADFNAGKKVFALARKDEFAPWSVYEACAMTAYHCLADSEMNRQVPSRIFNAGMTKHGGEVEYVAKYLTYLISIKDLTNARALFETVIKTFSPAKGRRLWEIWGKYEYRYGNLEAAHNMETRMAASYPKDSATKRFAQRQIYNNIDPIAERDLGVAMSRRNTTNPPATAQNNNNNNPTAHMTGGRRTDMPPPSHIPKRPRSRSPGYDRDYGPKRLRNSSPGPRGMDRGDRDMRDRDRDRWGDRDRRRNSPLPGAWDRGPIRRDREDERPPVPPPAVLQNFIGSLPRVAQFDGPKLGTEDMMHVFREIVIPASNARPRSPPPMPRGAGGGGGRPPPDYGPYQGPGGGSRSRRY